MNITLPARIGQRHLSIAETLRGFPLVALAALMLCSRSSSATVYTVNNSNDSGVGSLRQVIGNANQNPGPDSIHFNLSSAPYSIQPLTELPTITDSVVIDGSTQPGFEGRPLIELDGSQAGANASGLRIQSSLCTVRGLVINRFDGAGVLIEATGGNFIEGNYIGTDTTGTLAFPNRDGISANNSPGTRIGGTNPGAGNLISGNRRVGIQVGEGVRIDGNLIGTDVTGTVALPNQDSGMWVWGGNNQIGSAAPGARNVISGNGSYGVVLIRSNNRVQGNFIGTDVTGTAAIGQHAGVFVCCDSTSALIGGTEPGEGNVISGNHEGIDIRVSGTRVQGNLIGTDATGTTALANMWGIYLADNAAGNVIGGPAPGSGNLISGNSFRGISIFHPGSTGNLIQGNLIGTDVAGTAPLPNFEAIFIADGASRNVVGGIGRGEGNVIAYNLASGVTVVGGLGHGAIPLQNTIRGNSMHSNAELGIDLVNGDAEPISGQPTANDPLDADSGPNHLQNFPELESSVLTPSGVLTIKGSLDSTPLATFDLEFFASVESDPVGHGEGETLLGVYRVSTDSAGTARFTARFQLSGWAAGAVIAATATDLDGNTSEFSRAMQPFLAGPPSSRRPNP